MSSESRPALQSRDSLRSTRAPSLESRFVLALFGCLAASIAGARTWIVPGVIGGVGANGISFSTDVTLVNAGASPASVTILPIAPPGGPIYDPIGIALEAGQSHLVAIDFALPRGGALRISSAEDVFVFARLKAEAPTVSDNPLPPAIRASRLPTVESELLLRAGETGHSAWVAHSQDPSKGSRTNVAVVFADAAGGAATLTLYDEAGTILGTVAYDVASPAFLQTRIDALTTKDVPVGRISVAVTRGTACGYTGLVDNVSGDVSIVPLERAPSAVSPPASIDSVSVGVAQVVGRNGSVWHTDARLANPGTNTVTVMAELIRTDANSQAGLMTVPPGRTIEIREVVQSLFGVSVLTSGAILWRASAPILVSTRTRTGDTAATLVSAILPAVPLDSYPTSADAPANLADLRQDARFRTNLIAAAGSDGASFDLDLFDESGRLLASGRQSLAPLAWGEYPLDRLIAGVAPPPRSRVRVRVASGSVGVQAFVVENETNDPVVSEALPRGVRVPPGTPPLPPGIWGGAPNGLDHLIVDEKTISLFRQCQSGTFSQPSSLDEAGRFSVLGTYEVDIGPALQFDAILSGQTDGHTATVRVMPIGGAHPSVDTSPESFTLGAPFKPFIGVCPIDY